MVTTDRLVGEVIGNYKLVQRIGAGGMGVVYLAEHINLGKKVAIKLLHPQFAADEEIVERFRREARVLSSLEHPNIIRDIDFGSLRDVGFYLIMDYLEGETLKEVIARDKNLATPRLLSIFEQILDALEVAHSQGIVHRDLKPENIFIVRKRGVESVKILDFGIARITQGGSRQQFTNPGDVYGSPAYMSPEQAKGEIDKIDNRTDLYSVAAMFVEGLTGKQPFVGNSATEVMLAHLTKEPPAIQEMRPDLNFPPRINTIVELGMAKETVDRFRSARAFRLELRTIFVEYPFQPLPEEPTPPFPDKIQTEAYFSGDQWNQGTMALSGGGQQSPTGQKQPSSGNFDDVTSAFVYDNKSGNISPSDSMGGKRSHTGTGSGSQWDSEETRQLELESFLEQKNQYEQDGEDTFDIPSSQVEQLLAAEEEQEQQHGIPARHLTEPTHETHQEPRTTLHQPEEKKPNIVLFIILGILVFAGIGLAAYFLVANNDGNGQNDVVVKQEKPQKRADAGTPKTPNKQTNASNFNNDPGVQPPDAGPANNGIKAPEPDAAEPKAVVPEVKPLVEEKKPLVVPSIKPVKRRIVVPKIARTVPKRRKNYLKLRIISSPSRARVLTLRKKYKCRTPCTLWFKKYKRTFLLVQKAGYRVHPISFTALQNKTIRIRLKK